MTQIPWTLFLGNGARSHAAGDRNADRTFCGRKTTFVREWVEPGSEPGCDMCFPRYRREADAARRLLNQDAP